MTYSEITADLRIHSSRVGRLTGFITGIGYLRDEPPLSALVVNKNLGRASDGYFDLLSRMGLDVPENENGRISLWEQHLEACYERWSKNGADAGHIELVDTNEHVPDVGSPAPERRETTVCRVIRNDSLVRGLNDLYDNTCQVCGTRRQRSSTDGYSEGHHLQPLGSPHDGPDERWNVLVLCPTCHADFDYGMMSIDSLSNIVHHMYDSERDGVELTVIEGHDIAEESVEYHNQNIVTVGDE